MICRAYAKKSQRVLVLGATGSIGGAVADVLRTRGHSVSCLVRSSRAETRVIDAGFDTIRGDIRNPSDWIDAVKHFDSVVSVAITWSDDMAEVDQRLTTCLLKALATPNGEKAIIYTSGCWVYGDTAEEIATETSPYDPSPAFAWGIDTAKRVQEDRRVRGMVILPAMVYERDGGVFEPMIADADKLNRIRIVGSEKTRWTLVHREDLAHLYALMLERGRQGSIYNGSAIIGMEIGKIANVMSKRLGLELEPELLSVEEAILQMGPWAGGYSLDQQMSGKKAVNELGWTPVHTDVLAELA